MVNLDQGGFACASTRILPPPPDLADFVEGSFIRRDDAMRAEGRWRLVPDSSATLVICLRATARGDVVQAALVGARSKFADTDVSTRRLTLGVRFRPGVLPRLARERASAFTDRGIPLEDVFGSSGRHAVERFDERDPEGTLGRIHDFLRQRASGAGAGWMASAQHASSVAELARAEGMALRSLHARMQESIGLSPKRMLRIVRLHRALEPRRPSLGWAAVAAHAGFADQPHLVREFRALLGETPRQWFARGMI